MSEYIQKRDYGLKTDYLVTTAWQVGNIDTNRFEPKRIWIFETGWRKFTPDKQQQAGGLSNDVPIECLNKYIGKYLNWYVKNHNIEFVEWPTKGCAAALLTICTLKPEKLYLCGFDAFFTHKHHLTSPGGHDWECDKKVVEMAAGDNKVELEWIGPDENSISRFFDSA